MPLPPLTIASVNVARAEPRLIGGRRVTTAIGKRPVAGRVAVLPLGLEGDEQADLTVHGGLKKAVYAYPAMHYAFWRTVRAQARAQSFDDALPHGMLGENLTVDGMDENDCWIGDRWELPGCVLAVAEPRRPCFKFDAAMSFPQATKMMAQSGFCGAYLAVVEAGTVGAGDAVTVRPGPREVNLKALFQAQMRRKGSR